MTWIDLERGLRVDTRLQAHWALQIPAALGDQMIPARDDWSHSAMTWSPSDRLIVSGVASDRFRAALCLDDFSLRLLDPRGEQRDQLPLHGKTLQHGFDWLAERVDHALTFSELTIPDHPVKSASALLRPDPANLKRLSDTFANAHLLCEATRADYAWASETRIWPHHFDMATLVSVPGASAEASSIGVGLSPGDATCATPYFYVTPWPYPDPEGLPSVPGAGAWHTEGWVGAVLPVDALPATGQHYVAARFMSEYFKAARTRLTH